MGWVVLPVRVQRFTRLCIDVVKAWRHASKAEGLEPDDPAVRAAIDLVRWELELLAEKRRKPGFKAPAIVNSDSW